jgi:hypothetical protein
MFSTKFEVLLKIKLTTQLMIVCCRVGKFKRFRVLSLVIEHFSDAICFCSGLWSLDVMLRMCWVFAHVRFSFFGKSSKEVVTATSDLGDVIIDKPVLVWLMCRKCVCFNRNVKCYSFLRFPVILDLQLLDVFLHLWDCKSILWKTRYRIVGGGFLCHVGKNM